MSCNEDSIPVRNNFSNGYEIIEIDGCEYIMIYKDIHIDKAVGFLAHKGNCKNPIHFYNKNTIK
jgi:hypothetical protein